MTRRDDRGARVDPAQSARYVGQPGGGRDIRRDAPADRRADHSREQHRMVAELLTDCRDLALEPALRHRRHAEVVALGPHDLTVTDQVGLAVRRPPNPPRCSACPASPPCRVQRDQDHAQPQHV